MKCKQPAVFRYWWTDKWGYACVEHMTGIRAIGQFMGHSFPIESLTVGDDIHECTSETGEEPHDEG